MEQSENVIINNFFEQATELSQSINECVNNVQLVSSQINKTLECSIDEAFQQNSVYLNCGTENSKSFAGFIYNGKKMIGHLESFGNEKNQLEKIDENNFLKALENKENFKNKHSDIQKYFKILSVGVKRIAEATGKIDTSIESSDTILAFSDFLPENPEGATSSPLQKIK